MSDVGSQMLIIKERRNLDDLERSTVCAFLDDNNERFGLKYAPDSLNLILSEQEGNEILGGLFGSTNWGWLHVEILAVSPVLRGLGYGARLIEEAHKLAQARGCHSSYLDTFSFQALGFYQGLGYEIFGTLDQFPDQEKRYFLRCKLN